MAKKNKIDTKHYQCLKVCSNSDHTSKLTNIQDEFIFSLCAKSVWAVEIGAWLAICNHLVYLIWRVKHCGCRANAPRQEMNVCLCY